MDQRWKWLVAGAGAALALGAVMFVGFIYSGFYPIAANEPHSFPVEWTLSTLQKHAVARRAGESEVPDLTDADLLRDGAVLYHEHCAACHGAPGTERAIMGRGLNPDPPRLATEIREWNNEELFWIVSNGLKMAGMPAFDPGLSARERWATVAMMQALPQLTPEEYRVAIQGADSIVLALMRERTTAPLAPDFNGDPSRGRLLVEAYGCGSCHVIPGVPTSRGQVGPPLDKFGLRHYIAGAVLNNPDNLTRWLVAPEAVEPGTAMPAVGATPEEARHMAAYLLSLGDESLVGPKGILPASWLPK